MPACGFLLCYILLVAESYHVRNGFIPHIVGLYRCCCQIGVQGAFSLVDFGRFPVKICSSRQSNVL